jgi:hypothetical protein
MKDAKKRRWCLVLAAVFLISANIATAESLYVDVSRQQKWHRLRRLVRGGIQVFSCM